MKDIELLGAILSRLLESGEAQVTEIAEDEGTMLLIDSPDDQKGRIIGKRGRTIQALRAIFGAIGAKEGRLLKVDLRPRPEDLDRDEEEFEEEAL
ncbi:KH domain-containing protein [bacterium]|nr:KH domain-containing protein [bacterium]